MKSRPCKKYFSMVELVLAIGVAVIGVICVLGLLPVGLNANRDAVADNYLPDMAQMMLNFIQVNSDLNPGFVSGLPGAKPSGGDYNYPDDGPGEGGSWGGSLFGGFKDASGGLVLATSTPGEYLVVQQSVIDGAPVPECTGVMRVWRVTPDFSGELSVVPAGSRTVLVEVSWPADFPYERRVDLGNVRTYSLELFNAEAEVLP